MLLPSDPRPARAAIRSAWPGGRESDDGRYCPARVPGLDNRRPPREEWKGETD